MHVRTPVGFQAAETKLGFLLYFLLAWGTVEARLWNISAATSFVIPN